MNGGPERLMIHTGTPYPVLIGNGLLSDCGSLFSKISAPCRVMLVSDDTVAALYGDRVERALTAAGFSVSRFVFPHGEQSKTPETFVALVNAMAEAGLTRSDLAAALGGGVTGDLTGFAASAYLRGIRYVQLPTTVLAAVDSSVGGKTAVDLPAGKNLMGSFWQPSAVICGCDTFGTLPEPVFADGLAEAIKYGVLCDPELFEQFEAFSRGQDMTQIAARCVRIKEAYVVGDETDRGRRQYLNLGHTPAHAIEACSGYTISHGRAVAIGMAMMARASEKLGFAKAPFAERLSALLKKQGLPVSTSFSAEQLAAAAVSDKKRRGDRITLVMPLAIGDCCLYPVEIERLKDFFEAGLR